VTDFEIDLAGEAKWYVVRTQHRQERLALSSLSAGGVEPYLPMLPKATRKGELYAVPLFPSFLFVAFLRDGVGWNRVFSARGVRAVLGAGGRPQPVAAEGISQIRQRELAAFHRSKLDAPSCRSFKAGEIIVFKKGPWAEIEAIFIEQVGARRCNVLLRMLGDERICEADLAHAA